MSFGYSGSVNIDRGEPKIFSDETYYSFKINEFCRIGVDGNPLVDFNSGAEFIIKVGATYIFDRDTKISLSYPAEVGVVLPNYSVSSDSTISISTANDYVWLERFGLDPQESLNGYFRVSMGISQWKTATTDGEQYTDIRITQFGAVEKEILPPLRFWSTADIAMSYASHSFIVDLNLPPEYVFSLAIYSEQYLQLGSDLVPGKLVIERLPTATSYLQSYDLNHAHIPIDGYDATAQDSVTSGLDFSSDGLKLYIAGDSANAVDQFTLSTAYSTETNDVSYDGTFLVGTQESNITDVVMGNSDNLMFICGSNGDEINSYTLTTPKVITSGVTARSLFSVSAQDTAPQGIAWTSDGLYLLMAGGTNDTIYQYSASTPWDETTLYYDSKTIVCDDDVVGVDISDDDKYVFITYGNFLYGRVERYEIIGTTFDIESLSTEVQGLKLDTKTETAITGGRVIDSGKKYTYIGSTTEILTSIQLGYQDV